MKCSPRRGKRCSAHDSLRIGAPARKPSPNKTGVVAEHFHVAVAVHGASYRVFTGESYHGRHMPTSDRRQRKPVVWNAPFGAVRSLEPGDDVDEIVDFFTRGKEHNT